MGTGIWDWDWRSVLKVGIEVLGLGLWTGIGFLIENGDWDLVLGIKIWDWDLVLGN